MHEEEKDTVQAGVVLKAAQISEQKVTAEELEKINRFTLTPLKAEEVYTFKAMAGDNELDDRNYMPFTEKALNDLKGLYIGKPVIKDHWRSANNQVARIYDTEIKQDSGRKTAAGEPHTELIAKAYMIRSEKNEDLIKEIEAGIKKEVSTGVRVDKAICSICGEDNSKVYCRHFPGRTYKNKDGEEQTCLFYLDGAKEAYELSLVAVPAQPRAGTVKAFGDKAFFEHDLPLEDTKEEKETQKQTETTSAELELAELYAWSEEQE